LAPASILIVVSDRKVQRTVERILAGTGYPLDVAADLAAATASLAYAAPTLAVVDGAALESREVSGFFAAALAGGTLACILLAGPAQVAQLPAVLDLAAITNLLVHPMPVLGEELTITAHKLLRGDLFGAEKYLLWGTLLHATALTEAADRARIVNELAEQLRDRGISGRVTAMAMLVADELLSNAVHHAPIDDRGVRYRADEPRDAALVLDDRHRVDLRWGCDGRYLAIEVGDAFGSLDRDTVLRALAHSGAKEAGAGAGMGIALAYRSCDHLVFNLAPGKRTEVIALIDVRFPPGERVPASSYNVFVER
jgi:anti-sigma regulatory factor (Ser/Thr protein kinase)/CheY-like chemotaxis protein